ncbi:transcription factor HES-2-like [Nelusetta ayraudi]|uniref:transcription factor HES-2-like n=1 Tax=Nelusetta ayraudi TaxID=303726 RepID=UPI003F6F04B5
MKYLQDPEDAKATKKSLKPEVERRRRERINRSLESLKTLLLHEQEATQRRVEKAEILEHTVLFLQTQRQQAGPGGGGGRTHTFQDGFSSCLQRASRFLGPDGKAVLPGSALEASLAARVCRPHCSRADVQRSRDADHPSSSALLRNTSRSLLRFLVRESGHRLGVPALAASVPKRAEARQSPTNPRRPHKKEARVAEKRSPSRCQQAQQLLWRPWP